MASRQSRLSSQTLQTQTHKRYRCVSTPQIEVMIVLRQLLPFGLVHTCVPIVYHVI